MAFKEIIHASEDVSTVLKSAAAMGLTIQLDSVCETPEANILRDGDLDICDRGSFFLYRAEWVYGEPKFELITAGFNKGKYFQSPRINFSPIRLIFDGERWDNGTWRLGGGSILWHRDWLCNVTNVMKLAPTETRQYYSKLISLIDTKHRLYGGVHTYTVLGAAWEKLMLGTALPPFDYIDWPSLGNI